MSGLNPVIDDQAANPLPADTPLTSGTFRPVDDDDTGESVVADALPAPAPTPSSATGLSTFNGTDPNGTWSLYLVDDFAGDEVGGVTSWCVDILTVGGSTSTTSTSSSSTTPPTSSASSTTTTTAAPNPLPCDRRQATIVGTPGNDAIVGGPGADDLTGGLGNDTLRGDADNDRLSGDQGTDACAGGEGTNVAAGCET